MEAASASAPENQTTHEGLTVKKGKGKVNSEINGSHIGVPTLFWRDNRTRAWFQLCICCLAENCISEKRKFLESNTQTA